MSRIPVNIVPKLIFEEVSGRRRKITLTARALPTSGFKVGVSQRHALDYPQGNPEATLALFGAEEKDTQLSGAWHTKYLGGGASIEAADGSTTQRGPTATPATQDSEHLDTADGLYKAFDEWVRTGVIVKVTWGPVTRVGIIGDLDGEYRTWHDIVWSMTLNWMGRDEPRVAAAFNVEYLDRSFTLSLADRLAALRRTLLAPFDGAQDLFSSWQAQLNNVQSTYNTLRDVVDGYAAGFTSPFATVRSTVDLLRGMVVDIDNVAQDIATQSLEGLFGVVDSLSDNQDAASKMRASVWKATTAADMNTVSETITRALLAAEARVAEGNSFTYIAGSGESLRDVAQAFYDNADSWRGLAVYNNLSSATLVQGQLVQVPEILPT